MFMPKRVGNSNLRCQAFRRGGSVLIETSREPTRCGKGAKNKVTRTTIPIPVAFGAILVAAFISTGVVYAFRRKQWPSFTEWWEAGGSRLFIVILLFYLLLDYFLASN
jgi:hypothetical protein